jgi:hypothetical protein
MVRRGRAAKFEIRNSETGRLRAVFGDYAPEASSPPDESNSKFECLKRFGWGCVSIFRTSIFPNAFGV